MDVWNEFNFSGHKVNLGHEHSSNFSGDACSCAADFEEVPCEEMVKAASALPKRRCCRPKSRQSCDCSGLPDLRVHPSALCCLGSNDAQSLKESYSCSCSYGDALSSVACQTACCQSC